MLECVEEGVRQNNNDKQGKEKQNKHLEKLNCSHEEKRRKFTIKLLRFGGKIKRKERGSENSKDKAVVNNYGRENLRKHYSKNEKRLTI